ncbi:hypothetical protein AGR9A_Cc140031 [Agrobacterium salinitolerans str. Hayward 0363]|nr:hypothetical protein AGR9A_Cc140031 [Agrobacterium salinitolerans str. Hayward 0363]
MKKRTLASEFPISVFKTRLTIGAKKPDARRSRLWHDCFGTEFYVPVRGRKSHRPIVPGSRVGLEAQASHMVQELRIDQHIEADRHFFFFAPDQRAADLIADTENFQIEIGRHFQIGADIQFRAVKGNGPHQAAHGVLGAEMMPDEGDLAGPVDLKFLVHFVLGDVLTGIHMQSHDNLPDCLF